MILKELKAIQDRHGFLPEEELRRLAVQWKVPLYEIYGVASFYPHFRLKPRTSHEIKICTDISCHLRGASRLRDQIEKAINATNFKVVSIQEVSCLGQCDAPIAVSVNERIYSGLTKGELQARIEALVTGQEELKEVDLNPASAYSQETFQINPYATQSRSEKNQESFEALRKVVQERAFEDYIALLKDSGLRGMGGAGFPTGVKWEIVRNAPGEPKYVICNADESEPGTFKDRVILQKFPYLVIEGMLIGARVVGAQKGIIFIRHEYHREKEVLEEALQICRSKGIVGPNLLGSDFSFELEIFESAGGYICGEETALLEALEGKRAEPRNKPPFPGTHGLYGKPTLINNVETFAFIPAILLKGAEWFKTQGKNGAAGLKFLALSGEVQRPGVYEVSLGISAAELIFNYGRGISNGKKLKAFAPGGASSGFLPARMVDIPLDFQSLARVGSMLGSGAVIAIAEGTCMVDLARNVIKFFRNESCGKCVPCRIGSEKLVEILDDIRWGKGSQQDLDWIRELSETMQGTSICGLGQAAPYPITSVIQHFPEEIEAHILKKQCPSRVCF
ncbi:MAG TPA: NADH-quinone oxidoreductase subunit NuoF [Candidatus Limnocylindrales bacterium]|nr:NADH-quinone oxidoreductase subunit NuoF [Candidatus Limnocylindrales bacterium]